MIRKQMLSTPTGKGKVRNICVDKGVLWTHVLRTTPDPCNEILLSFYMELSSLLIFPVLTLIPAQGRDLN